MRCRKVKRLISLYLAADKSWLRPTDRRVLEAHLAACEPCRRDCQQSREAISILHECWQISPDTAALLNQGRRQGSYRAPARVIRLLAASRRVAVWGVAACLVVGVFGWLSVVRQQGRAWRESTTAFSGGDASLLIERPGTGVRIQPGTTIETTTAETEWLLLNRRHQIVMNAGTKISIEPLVGGPGTGWRVNLALGEIFVRVEHDGNPLEVHSPHGRAVVTGTTFDVAVVDHSTRLAVSEGSVQFESNAGTVHVTAGQQSVIVGKSAPNIPVRCQTDQLMAWATSGPRRTSASTLAADFGSIQFPDPSDELPLPVRSLSPPLDLESLDYDEWVESKRDWFEGQFPWAFELQQALAKERVDSDYPDLLIESGALWRLVCPDVASERSCVTDGDSLLKVALGYGFDRQWLLKNVSAAASILEGPPPSDDRLAIPAAFERWLEYLDRTDELGLPAPTPIYSYRVSQYLIETRSLIWFAVRDGEYDLTDDERAVVLSLLEHEITVARECQNEALFAEHETTSLCTEGEVQSCADRVRGYVEKLSEIEKNLGAYAMR